MPPRTGHQHDAPNQTLRGYPEGRTLIQLASELEVST